MGFLAKVALYSDVNLMTVNNIAIVFAPTLLRPLGDKMDQIIQDSGHGNYLIKLMIEEYNSIFEQQVVILFFLGLRFATADMYGCIVLMFTLFRKNQVLRAPMRLQNKRRPKKIINLYKRRASS